VFVDVDLTLVDANGRLLPGARPALEHLKAAGCHLFLWSSVGMAYAIKVAKGHGLEDLFEGYSAKPDIIIDDMPGTTRAPFAYNVHEEDSWEALADRIVKKHVDLP
ncbi:MAG: hypothetical protein RIS76_3362, partial [Verrucomicrobiota bacterium]